MGKQKQEKIILILISSCRTIVEQTKECTIKHSRSKCDITACLLQLSQFYQFADNFMIAEAYLHVLFNSRQLFEWQSFARIGPLKCSMYH